jgi:hypothetical protein
MVAAPTLAQAQIVWSGTVDITAAFPSQIVITASSTADFTSVSSKNVGAETPIGGGSLQSNVSNSVPVSFSSSSVSFGSTIDSSSGFLSPVNAVTSSNIAGTYYFGFALGSGGETKYGWLELEARPGAPIFHQWAYNSVAGASITAGQTSAVPEPATYGALLGVAALGAVFLRRRRRAARA